VKPDHTQAAGDRSPSVSRRGLLGAAGVGAVGLGAGAAGGLFTGSSEAATPEVPQDRYPFYGEHQAGIVTPMQDRLHFAAFDVITESRDELVALLMDWTAAAARMTVGEGPGELGPTSGPYDAPPDDTGEAIGLPAAKLTLTFGLGPTLFERDGKDRFGLAARRPEALRRLPHFPGDKLDPDRSDGDLCVQACADDPQVAVHAVRNLARIAFGRAAIRWSQLGFGRTSSTSTAQATPRNLFGFKDGSGQPQGRGPPAGGRPRVAAGRRRTEGRRPEGRVVDRWVLPGGKADQHDHRDLGPAVAAGAGGGDRGGPRPRGRRCPAGTSSPHPTSRCRAGGSSR